MSTRQIWSVSKIQKLPISLRRKIEFYAPLIHNLDYWGVGEASFTRAGVSSAIGRDGAGHSVQANTPRFEYSGEAPLGVRLDATETLRFHPGNRLEAVAPGTFIWFEDDIAKIGPWDESPFDQNGIWQGSTNIHLKDVVKFSEPLTDPEINAVLSTISDQPQSVFSAPTERWLIERPFWTAATKARLSYTPDLNALLVSIDGVFLKRVAANPGLMQFSLSDRDLTLGWNSNSAEGIRAHYRLGGSVPSLVIEDLAGTKNGSNTTFSVSIAPVNGFVMVFHQGVSLKKVIGTPGFMQFQNPSGTTIEIGVPPEAGDDLWAMLQDS